MHTAVQLSHGIFQRVNQHADLYDTVGSIAACIAAQQSTSRPVIGSSVSDGGTIAHTGTHVCCRVLAMVLLDCFTSSDTASSTRVSCKSVAHCCRTVMNESMRRNRKYSWVKSFHRANPSENVCEGFFSAGDDDEDDDDDA